MSKQYEISLYKCELKGGKLIPRGSAQTFSYQDARSKFCTTGDPRAKLNLINAKRGNYLGIRKNGNKIYNFLLVNRTDDGDIRWLLKKVPELDGSIMEVYLVDQVDRPKTAKDLLEISK